MKNKLKKVVYRLSKLAACLAIGLALFTSCSDPYIYDNQQPTWLGSSIYDYLNNDGHYTTYVKLINDLDLKEVLSLTGSKTLFVANDSAFDAFFKNGNNPWGVTKYEDLTLAQKKYLLKFSMINNAYILTRLANYNSGGTLYEGTAMRQVTELSALDSIPFVSGDDLPTSKYWDADRTKGIYLLSDNTDDPTVFFTQAFIDKYALTNNDLDILLGIKSRASGDVDIFNDKIIKSDITCKNGYIDVLQSVLVPPSNMAQYISQNAKSTDPNQSTSIFSKLLDRFCAPYYDAASTATYHELHPEFTDSIFVKKYFASLSSDGTYNGWYLPNSNKRITTLLPFDPGWNSYNSGAIESDMAAMFVPDDQAMKDFLHSGIGAVLGQRFDYNWDSIPDNIVLPFIKRHMRKSFIESVPSKFSKMVDAQNYALPVKTSEIVKTYTAVNGEVYVTNNVYPPVDYISVYSPILLSSNTRVFNWALNISEASSDGTLFAFYKLYLNSLVSKYGVIVPTDEFFSDYIDPVAYGQDVSAALKFKYDAKNDVVNAVVYKYDKSTGTVGDSIAYISGSTSTGQAFMKNRLWQILDSHIIVGDIQGQTGNSEYYVTKANDIIKVDGTGTNMTIQGGQDIMNGTKCKVTKVFNQYNGTTYFVDKPIDPSLRSVYKVLSETPAFDEFYKLVSSVPDTCIQQIFQQQGVDYRVTFFNAYRYTVYVPTDSAIDAAVKDGRLMTWSDIQNIQDPVAKSAQIQRLIRILKYHFQDNAVFTDESINQQYQSATIKENNDTTYYGTAKNKYYKIGVVGNGARLTLTMDSPGTTDGSPIHQAHTTGKYDNIIAKDYIFSKLPSKFKNADGTGAVSGAAYNTSKISTSASAVIQQIDNVLSFE